MSKKTVLTFAAIAIVAVAGYRFLANRFPVLNFGGLFA